MKTTKRPWKLNIHTHVDGDFWATIGYFDSSGQSTGPICDVTHMHIFPVTPAAEFKYLNTSEDTQRANAELIVRAVNCHDDLVKALEALIEHEFVTGSCDELEALLKKAKGES